jgi:hypothetical protein
MLRTLIFSVLALALLFTSASCARFTNRYTRKAPSGAKEGTIADFSYTLNNNQHSKAPIYKKYINARRH